MYDLTGFQRDLLYVIAGLDDPHGLAIKEEPGDYYDKEIHHGRLYPNLDTLVDKGLVEKGEQDRRTNFYTVTRRGERELEARQEWVAQYINFETTQSWIPILHSHTNNWQCLLHTLLSIDEIADRRI